MTRSSCSPRIRVAPEAKAAATARIGYSSIIEGARAAGTSTPRSGRCAHPQVRHVLAALERGSRISICGAHLPQRREEPGAQRVHHHAFDHDVRSRHDQRGDDGESGRRGIGRNDDGRRTQFRPADERDPPPLALGLDRDLGAEMASIFSVWSREASASITVVTPGALRPASSTADLICAEATGVRYSIGAGSRAPLSTIGQRPPSASDRTCAPISRERIEDAAHRPLAQRGVAVEGRGDAMAADDAHHQPRAGAGVAEIERLARGAGRRRGPARGCASARRRAARRPRRAPGRPCRCASTSSPSSSPSTRVSPQVEQAEKKGAMGDRLVARRPDPAVERRARMAVSGEAAE